VCARRNGANLHKGAVFLRCNKLPYNCQHTVLRAKVVYLCYMNARRAFQFLLSTIALFCICANDARADSFDIVHGPIARTQDDVDFRATVYVTHAAGDGVQYVGAGVIVATDGRAMTVLTASHVIDGAAMQIYFSDGLMGRVTSVKEDAQSDLAIVAVIGDHAYDAVALSNAAPVAGAPYTLIGHPDDYPYVRSRVDFKYDDDGALAVKCICSFGDSGAGIFSPDHRLMGVAISLAQSKAGDVYLLAPGVAKIRHFIQRVDPRLALLLDGSSTVLRSS
jgi:hypothetical protein